MEASIAEQDITATEPVARTADAQRMFKYSAYLDVGEGAAECEHARDGQCEDIEHVHAWCRLPNPYQHDDIREKGLAAKARKIRELRDRDSDAAVVLEEQIALLGDGHRETLVDELLNAEWAPDYLEAQRRVEEREEFTHIAQDREELNRLSVDQAPLPDDEQSAEFRQLTKHMGSYVEAMRTSVDEVQAPKRQELEALPLEELIERVRTRRINDAADRAFLDTYNPWMWFVGTFKVARHPTLGRPHIPMWEEIGRKDRGAIGTMYGEAPEVIDGLRDTFNELQLALQRGSAGN